MYNPIIGDVVPPQPKDTRRPRQNKHDIKYPSISPGYYQHIGREPNTNYHFQLREWQMKKIAEDDKSKSIKAKSFMKNEMLMKYEEHVEKRHLQRLIQDRVQKKIEDHEDWIEKRRNKLQDLLWKEEREYNYETIEQAQTENAKKMENMKQRAELLRARREEDRLKLVHEKRIEQYKNRFLEIRPILIKQHLMESKYGQIQQMRENEARREEEREIDRMWHELNAKEMKAKIDREEQEAIIRKREQQGMMDVWAKQIKGKELLKAEEEKTAHEDRLEMIKLSEQLRREEIEALDAKRRKRDKIAQELIEQVMEQEVILEERKRKEKALDDAYALLARLEIKKEKEAIQDMTTQARKETAMYRQQLKELEIERKKEEQELNDLLEIHGKEVQKKQDEARCKIKEAKRKLQEDVLAGRAEQIAHKKQAAEEQLKLRQAETEVLRMRLDQNERLQAESDRLEAASVRQYREDLKQQIEYNNLLRERERQELDRQIREGMREEEKYQKIVNEMVKESIEGQFKKHPFRVLLEQTGCNCPTKPS